MRRASIMITMLMAIAFIFPTLAGISASAKGDEPISCEVAPKAAASPAAADAFPAAAPKEGELIKVTMGYVKASIFAPVFIAKEKGYFAEQGLDVTLEALPGGGDMVALTANGDYDAGIGGAGPAFWNGIAAGLPLKAIAPGHQEGNPVATPLMISKKACESGAITKISDLKGKKVSVNAPGATEYWLSQALAEGGLTIDDIELQTLPFPDAVAALESGAIDAAMIGEPLATGAEMQGIAVRLATDFSVQDIQPTVVFANADWIAKNPEAATGLVTAYLKACREMSNGGFDDPADLAIIEQYTGIPAAAVQAAVRPVYVVDGQISIESMNTMQAFFRGRGLLAYDTDLDPNAIIDMTFVNAALEILGPAE